MILSDGTLYAMLDQLIRDPDPTMINPASIDIRIGAEAIVEVGPDVWETVNLKDGPTYRLPPGGFALVSTLEWLMVPNGYAMELKLKSSSARKGYDHSLAFWFDPGWSGVGTMEVKNVLLWSSIPLSYGQKFAQVIYHVLDKPAVNPYRGRYQHAMTVEAAKP